MKKTILLIFFALLCFSQISLAVDYEMPDNFNALMDQTYKCIYQYLDVDETLSYDLFLFDEYSLALSALSRGQVSDMTYEQIKGYFHMSLDLYRPDENFLLMVMIYEAGSTLDLSQLAAQVALQNSQNELLSGAKVEQFNDSIFILSFPKAQVEQFLKHDDNITVRLLGKTDTYHQVFFDKNYRKQIPAKITELVNLLLEPLEPAAESAETKDPGDIN